MLAYEIIGTGKPVVFIHGFLESSTMWKVFPLERMGFQCVLIDLPGHGRSTHKHYTSFQEIALEIDTLLKQLNIIDYGIVGHSLGGYVGIELHKLAGIKAYLILFHSNFWEDDAKKKEDRNRVIELVQKNKRRFIREAIPNLFMENMRTT